MSNSTLIYTLILYRKQRVGAKGSWKNYRKQLNIENIRHLHFPVNLEKITSIHFQNTLPSVYPSAH